MTNYFPDKEAEFCGDKKTFQIIMKLNKVKEMTVYKAVRMVGSGYFFCKLFEEVGETGEGCGKQKQYAALLGDYFEGYKTTTVSSNFSKSVY